MYQRKKASLQRGMNFRLGGDYSVILMPVWKYTPRADRYEGNGGARLHEGRDVSRACRLWDCRRKIKETVVAKFSSHQIATMPDASAVERMLGV